MKCRTWNGKCLEVDTRTPLVVKDLNAKKDNYLAKHYVVKGYRNCYDCCKAIVRHS